MRSDHKFTKWRASGSSVWSDFGCIAVSIASPQDAALIAAAPDLLEAIEELIEEVENDCHEGWSHGFQMARAAIAAARGES